MFRFWFKPEVKSVKLSKNIRLKTGVSMHGVQDVMIDAANIIGELYKLIGVYCYITSGREGTHSSTSKHYEGLALDFRIRSVPFDKRAGLISSIADNLGPDYDVVREETHIHVEYDPS